MGKEKTCVFQERPKCLFFSEYQKQRDKKLSKLQDSEKSFWPSTGLQVWQIAAGIRENPCPLVTNSPETETHSFSVSERSREVCHFDKRASLHKVLSERVGNTSKMFSRGQKEQMKIQIRTFLIVFGLQQLVFSILKDTVWKGYVMPKKFLLPSSHLWSNVKSTSASNI